jgi:c-di-AMP phosphodiesterase-like protein
MIRASRPFAAGHRQHCCRLATVALTSVLAELKELRMVRDDHIDLLKEQFDHSMTKFLHTETEGTVTIQHGSTVSFRWVQDYCDCALQPAVIQFANGSYTSPSLQIIAVKGQEKKSEDKGK